MRVIYHQTVEAELIGAAKFYDARVCGLGSEFLAEFDHCIEVILEAPQRWRIVSGDFRRYLMPRFPYGLYYRIEGDEVRLLVVKHHSQHPDYGMGRR